MLSGNEVPGKNEKPFMISECMRVELIIRIKNGSMHKADRKMRKI
jgi:hypothetical protein